MPETSWNEIRKDVVPFARCALLTLSLVAVAAMFLVGAVKLSGVEAAREKARTADISATDATAASRKLEKAFEALTKAKTNATSAKAGTDAAAQIKADTEVTESTKRFEAAQQEAVPANVAAAKALHEAAVALKSMTPYSSCAFKVLLAASVLLALSALGALAFWVAKATKG